MALVQKPVYDVTISLVDRDLNVSTMTCYVPTTSLIGAVEAAITGYIIPAIQGISNAVVKAWSITTSAVDDAAVTAAPEESDVERKGVFSFRAVNGSVYVVSVPSIINDVVIDRTNLIDLTDPLVVAFTNAIATPATLEVITPSTYLASDIIQCDKAEKHHRGSRRG